MTTKFKHSLVILITGLSFITTTAQTPTALDNLFRFDGSWAGEATLILEGNTFNFTYYADFKKNNESSGMYMEEWFSHPDLGSLKGYNLIGYNARDEKIHWFSVDNFGTCHEHLGYWKTNDHFYMETTEKHKGKKFEEKIDIIFKSNDELLFHLIATIGGQLYEDATVIFHRQNATGNKTNKEEEKSTNRNPSGILKEEQGSKDCKVYPNPADKNINVQVNNNILSPDLKFSVFNLLGVKQKEICIRSAITSFSLDGFKPGMYLYKVNTRSHIIYSGQFIVQ